LNPSKHSNSRGIASSAAHARRGIDQPAVSIDIETSTHSSIVCNRLLNFERNETGFGFDT